LEQEFHQCLEQARSIWNEQSEVVKTLLLEDTALNQRSYKKDKLPQQLTQLEDVIQASELILISDDERKNLKKFTQNTLNQKTKNNCQAPVHPLFECMDRLDELLEQIIADYIQAGNHIRFELFNHVQSELVTVKHDQGVLSFNDLLLCLHTVLVRQPDAGFARQLLKRFPVALVDEFQDTDPIQYEIFDAIYKPGNQDDQALYFVGDPKQAIYSFRGADIYTYLKARTTVQHPWWTLDSNWRSSKSLIAAINHIYSSNPRPFWLESIEYQDVVAAQGETLDSHLPDDYPALRCWSLHKDDAGALCRPLDKNKARPVILDALCNEIAELLNQGQCGQFCIDSVPVSGADIAVLVRTNEQAVEVRDCLAMRGISSAFISQASVFNTMEATELGLILHAVSQPTRHQLIRAALATEIIGLSASQIASFDSDSERSQKSWEDWLITFHNWQQDWLEHGFMHVFRAATEIGQCYSRWLALSDGERRLTDLVHLAELINRESQINPFGIQGLVRWFDQQCHDQQTGNEDVQLRLESDENLVRIVTIHASKGLEYNLVFCPFLWDSKSHSQSANTPFVFHDPEQGHRACLEMGSKQREQGLKYLANENFAEDLRLLYVALTRAKYHCTIVTGHIKGIESSAFGWLLYGKDDMKDLEQVKDYIANLDAAEKASVVESNVKNTNGVMVCCDIPRSNDVVQVIESDQIDSTKSARQFEAVIDAQKQVKSFTSLVYGVEHSHIDDDLRNVDNELAVQGFPLGIQAGICLHQMFEHLDFTQPVLEQMTQLETILTASQFAEQTERLLPVVSEWLQSVLDTPLQADGGCCLAQISHADRVDELGFYFPLLQATQYDIKQLIKHFYTDSLIQTAASHLPTQRLSGWMRGFIDLVFRYNGQYYIVDYKSNWLGHNQDAYQPEQLTKVIADRHYYLQYLIYSVALHQYLQVRLPGYHYQQHFGGVYYLFIRGMSEDQPGQSGIYFDRPQQSLIEQLSESMMSDKAVA
ncbi:MAG: exodeoxyribonuclease V subunit beta, partial [Gammaproteobacteria bacterium]|nr:exodeoxyribonuclease V subunit beta [Gammaproteobacteria bacterium]